MRKRGATLTYIDCHSVYPSAVDVRARNETVRVDSDGGVGSVTVRQNGEKGLSGVIDLGVDGGRGQVGEEPRRRGRRRRLQRRHRQDIGRRPGRGLRGHPPELEGRKAGQLTLDVDVLH